MLKREVLKQIISRYPKEKRTKNLNRAEYAQHKLWVNCTPVGSEGISRQSFTFTL